MQLPGTIPSRAETAPGRVPVVVLAPRNCGDVGKDASWADLSRETIRDRKKKKKSVTTKEARAACLHPVHYGAVPLPQTRQESVKQQSARAANLTPMDPSLASKRLVIRGPHRVLRVQGPRRNKNNSESLTGTWTHSYADKEKLFWSLYSIWKDRRSKMNSLRRLRCKSLSRKTVVQPACIVRHEIPRPCSMTGT